MGLVVEVIIVVRLWNPFYVSTLELVRGQEGWREGTPQPGDHSQTPTYAPLLPHYTLL